MCGRFAFFSPGEAIAAAFGVAIDVQLEPRYNIAPSQQVTVLRLDEQGRIVAGQCRWGLVPFWAKDPAIGNRMINARAETITAKPSYRQAFSRRRCLVLADGFYEWHQEEGAKVPYFISRSDGAPFAMAGIWDEWAKGAVEPLQTCAVITVPANQFMQQLHHRMPVVMGPNEVESWLPAGTSPAQLQQSLLNRRSAELRAWAVSRSVNNPLNEGPGLILSAAR